MATKIKIVTTGDFLEVTPEGIINITTSRQLLVDIARAGHRPVDYDLLIDFRDTKWHMSIVDLYRTGRGTHPARRYFSQKSGAARFSGSHI